MGFSALTGCFGLLGSAVMRRFVLGIILLFPLGCSTPAPDITQHPVAAERRFEPALLRPSHRRSCALTITREKGVPARGLNVFLDGEQLARIAAGELITVYVKPGRHSVGVKPLFSPPAKRVCVLSKGESASIRILDRNGKDELDPTQGPWLGSIEHPVHSLGQ